MIIGVSGAIGINRIRLEFKAKYGLSASTPAIRINRIRLEFKVVAHVCFLAHAPGLIESDWNLKPFLFPTTRKIARINRIRLEFKAVLSATANAVMYWINRIRLEFKVESQAV